MGPSLFISLPDPPVLGMDQALAVHGPRGRAEQTTGMVSRAERPCLDDAIEGRAEQDVSFFSREPAPLLLMSRPLMLPQHVPLSARP
uniref:Uncharacterized protein n=1 Tax=Otus sunia TaxID=257818 RepID=A0A8C8E5B6_9STRI